MTLDWLEIARGVAQQLDSPTMAIYWLYLLTAGAIALAVYWRRFPGPRRNVRGLLRFVFPPHPAWRRSDPVTRRATTALRSVSGSR